MPWGQRIRRGNRKTFVYCVKLILSDGKPINKKELFKYIDDCMEICPYILHNNSYFGWFTKYCLEINNILRKAGFKTRIK